MSQHEGACSRGGDPGGVFPPGTAAVSKHETGTVIKQTTGARGGGSWGVPGGFPPRHDCCAQARDRYCDKQTTGALQFMVAFALQGGGCYTSANISHFVVPWEAGGASPNQHASDLYHIFKNKSRECFNNSSLQGGTIIGALG